MLTLASASVATATTTAKPQDELVPAGAGAVSWRYPLPVENKVLTGTITVTTPSVIARVRALINSLPLTSSAPRICPEFVRLPETITFETSAKATPFTRVVFQLGGCPSATVYQHGVAISPTLGGKNIGAVYAEIQKLISPQGQPLA